MSVLGALSVSSMAMNSQATALHQIGTNVSNVQTGGYRRSDVHFQSILGNQMFNENDQGGARPVIHQRIDSQGLLVNTTSTLDLAISGDGFFVTSTDFAATDIVYTRDGSFQQAAVNDITVVDPISGQTFNTKDGYLVDKNGHYLLGYAARADGSFPTTGDPAPMRIDKNAFAASGIPTTAADLIVNLDSNAAIVGDHLTAVNNLDSGGSRADGMEILTIDFVDDNGTQQDARLNFTKAAINTWDVSATHQGAGTAQVDTVTLGGAIEVGDTYRVAVGNTTVSYTATATDTMATVVASLVTALNGDTQIAARATAAAGALPGSITLTAATAGTAITTTASATNGTGTAQVDTLTVSGVLEAGDVYQVTVGGSTVSYNVTGGEGALSGVVSGIVATINGTSPINNSVLASVGANPGEITLTSRATGTPFTATARALDTSSTAQVDTVTIGGTMVIGDVYSVTVDGNTVSYTVDGTEGGLAGVRTALRDAINADTTVNQIATATNGGPLGDIVLTAQVPGTPMTSSAAATDGGGPVDNTATVAPTTANVVGPTLNTATLATTVANVTAAADNTATTATTTANDTGLVTSAVTRVSFVGDGRAGTESLAIVGAVDPPADISFSFAFPAVGTTAAGTASFTLDVSGMTQLDNPFLLQRYSEDGEENALIQEVGFDAQGHVVGFFSNGNSQALFQVPLAKFSNPNALETASGMVFRETEQSGTPSVQTIEASGIAVFIPGAVEISNVILEDEFTNIIRTQQAYNSNANAFRAVDEMLETTIQMKR